MYEPGESPPDTCPNCCDRQHTVRFWGHDDWWCPTCKAWFEHGALAAKQRTARVSARLLAWIPEAALHLPTLTPTRGLGPERFDRLVDECIGAAGMHGLLKLAHLKLDVIARGGGAAYEEA
jgi:hypothetical protein